MDSGVHLCRGREEDRRKPKKTVLDIARKNPALYKKLRGIYADRYIGELLDENGKLRADAEEYLTEEMAADLIGYTLSDPEILANLTGEQRNVLQKFVDKLVSMFGDKNLKAASEYLSNADADIRAIFKDVAKEADVIAEQFKAALDTSKKAEKNTVERDGVRSSKGLSGEDEKYSYSTLISKPDMKLTIVDEAVPDNRADIIEQAKKNASAVGIVDKTTKAISVYVDDIGDSVIIGAKGLQHGLRRKSTLQTDATSIVTLKAGEIIKNSIRINELTPKYDNVDSAYALIGAAKNSNGDLYIVESVVNRFNNELVSMEVLYSVNAKKENRLSSMLPRIQPPVTDSTISIADFLDVVKDYYSDVLSNDVLKHFEIERKHSALSDSVKHSKELFTDDRTMSAEEIENVFKSSRKVTLNFSNAVDKWLSGKKKKTRV